MTCHQIAHVRSYRDLVVWQTSMALVANIYRCTQALPKAEVYGLAAQLRRAAISVPSNIAEGQGRISTGEFKQFLGHARGSLLEIETQISIAQDLGFLSKESCAALPAPVHRSGQDSRRPHQITGAPLAFKPLNH